VRNNPTTLGAAALALCATLAAQKIHPDEFKLKPQIDQAIAAGVEHLLDGQVRDGSWGVHPGQPGGQTGLCAYALLKSGVSPDHPSLQRAFAYLDGVTPDKTYAVGCMLLAYGATGKREHKARMRELLDIMLRIQGKPGTWGYPHGAPDLSNTQYAALGLWSADKAGLKVPAEAWQRLIEGTLTHQEAYRLANVDISDRTGVAKREVAGFQYRANGAKDLKNATGTMTTAGVSILKICEIGLGSKLKKDARKELTRALNAGLGWLEVNFSVQHDQRPGQRSRGWFLYYLYGMERVGGLAQQEQFGSHWWYVEGAPEVLRRQKNGSWGKTYDTCFALLFLRRATKLGPTTGSGGAVASRHLFSVGKDSDDVYLQGAGQQPLMLYLSGFGPPLQATHKDYGLRILRVDYLEGDRVLGQVAGDPTRAWHPNDTFLHRCTALSHGVHKIRARIELVDPKVPTGETTETVTIESAEMDVNIRDVIEPWMQGLADMQKSKGLKDTKFEVTATSNAAAAVQAADGQMSTSWLCDKADQEATLTLTFPEPVKARRLLLTQPFQKREDIQRMGLVRQIEVRVNGSKRPVVIDLHPNPMAPTEHAFRKLQRVKTMTVKVIKRGGKPGLPVGFAEVVLDEKKK
jgi:hypothetical protein